MADKRECELVREHLAAVVDGEPPASLREHLASCDECRDLRHAAQRVADLLVDAGADYVPPRDLESRLMAAIDARAPSTVVTPAVKPATAEPSETRESARATTTGKIAGETAVLPDRAPARREREVVLLTASEAARRKRFLTAASLVAAAAAIPLVIALRSNSTNKSQESNASPVASTSSPRPDAAEGQRAWRGRIALVSRAADDPGAGIEVRPAGSTEFRAAREGDEIPAGATLRTDDRTRARVEFSDGTRVVLDRGSELGLDARAPRSASLARGAAVADVAHLDGSPRAHIQLPTGAVTVLGTKFALDATSERSTVRVTRGTVKVTDTRGDELPVQTGQQGVLPRTGNARVEPAPDLATSVSWAELSRDVRVEPDAPVLGLGELRARRPGESAEHDQRVHLASHSVRVRVAGEVARTEVDEVFRNDTGSELEGIFRFPLPPDAQIESLALDVHGEMQQGEFVDRQRAAAIWRGVIRNAVRPVTQRVETQEYVWVPGPWRDPALLEWQRGGRFELRVFPIPAHGERRVSLAYTQTVPAQGGVRRYVYPLAHDASGSTRVDTFSVDAQVLGADESFGVHPRGYEFQNTAGLAPGATRMTFARGGFVPAGDVVLEYALPDRAQPVSAWAFQPPAEAIPVAPPTVGITNVPGAVYAQPSGSSESAYVAVALRPTLPRWTDVRPRDYALVVDASRSMVGERLARARRLLSAMVSEMDPRDRVTVLACDTACRAMPGGLITAGPDAAHRTENFLAGIEAGGASDLVAQVHAAAVALGASADRDARIVYLGDGAPTAGYRRPDRVEAAVAAAMPSGRASLTAVAVGSDADTSVLGAMARAGGGAVVPYVPGESLASAALSVLQTTYGVALRDATVTLPDGMTEMHPSRLGTVRAGGEVTVLARMNGGRARGDLVLRGTVGGEPFETRYPLDVSATTDPGNAFVPRMYAAAQIADLESEEGAGTREQVVALSQRFHVASRHTSLLVLESDAMYRAFGVQRTLGAWWTHWTGEQAATPSAPITGSNIDAPDTTADPNTVEGLLGDAQDDDHGEPTEGTTSDLREHSGEASGPVRADNAQDRNASANEETESGHDESAPPPAAQPGDADLSDNRGRASGHMAMPSPAQNSVAAGASTAPATITTATTGGAVARSEAGMRRPPPANFVTPPSWPPRGQWMRRIHVRRASLADARDPGMSDLARVESARAALALAPDSRDRHVELYRALSVAGEADEAAAVAARWAGRDALDPEALARLAEGLHVALSFLVGGNIPTRSR